MYSDFGESRQWLWISWPPISTKASHDHDDFRERICVARLVNKQFPLFVAMYKKSIKAYLL